ncbi:MAG TPA: hypothetical protein VET23_15810 [Chitinophagaceae bacterium]|nr:hypothetical protein [Chitinophagaceae bacterium]
MWLTYANTRYRFGSLVQNEPSRFIDELPESFLDKSFAGGGAKNQSFNNWNKNIAQAGTEEWQNESGKARLQSGTYFNEKQKSNPGKSNYLVSRPAPKTAQHIPSADFAASDTSKLSAGQKVEHQKFGFGEVVKMEGSAHNPIATIRFELNGEKKIMLNYARLRIVE